MDAAILSTNCTLTEIDFHIENLRFRDVFELLCLMNCSVYFVETYNINAIYINTN